MLGINLEAVYIADAIGILLMIILAVANKWRITSKTKTVEDRLLFLLIILALLSCLMDSISSSIDGAPGGMLIRVFAYISNLWLFTMNIVMGPLWVLYLGWKLSGGLSKRHRRHLIGICSLGAVILVLNTFIPLVFRIDENNVYSRGPLFAVYLVIQLTFITESLIMYYRAKQRGGFLKYFPVGIYVLPILAGILIQFIFYGVSTIWPFMTVSIAGITATVQNEMIFKDKLTGIYNRFYLDNLFTEKKNAIMTAMMLDLNGFKKINDEHGHSIGDDALIKTAEILIATVGSLGTVVRYAGDEFVIILNTTDDFEIAGMRKDIERAFRDFNEKGETCYELSASIGYCPVDLSKDGMNELLHEIDRRMYEYKRQYYINHDRRRSR